MWQYHSFTLTSAPEEDYVSVHIRCVGDFTRALADTLGCHFDGQDAKTSAVIGVNRVTTGDNVDPTLRRILPRLYIDGPFGSASEDVFKYEVVALVGAGISVTPFASVLKSIWYRLNYPRKKMRLRKVYFFWVCRDFESFEWFRSLLSAIEAQDLDHQIEIHTVRLIFVSIHSFRLGSLTGYDGASMQYLTGSLRVDDATNIMINDSSQDQDVITGLRAPTNFDRPHWDAIFERIKSVHSPGQGGIFFCGPKPLGYVLHERCKIYSDPEFTFAWCKENF